MGISSPEEALWQPHRSRSTKAFLGRDGILQEEELCQVRRLVESRDLLLWRRFPRVVLLRVVLRVTSTTPCVGALSETISAFVRRSPSLINVCNIILASCLRRSIVVAFGASLLSDGMVFVRISLGRVLRFGSDHLPARRREDLAGDIVCFSSK